MVGMEDIIKEVLICIKSSLSVEIIAGSIRDLSNKAGLTFEETLQILRDNYDEWEK